MRSPSTTLPAGTGTLTTARSTAPDRVPPNWPGPPSSSKQRSIGKPYSAPLDLRLARNQDHDIVIAKDGYQSIEFTLKANRDMLSLIDIPIPFNPISAFDARNGADRAFPTLAAVRLDKIPTPTTQPTQLYEYHGKLMTREEYDKAESGLDTGDSGK